MSYNTVSPVVMQEGKGQGYCLDVGVDFSSRETGPYTSTCKPYITAFGVLLATEE